MEVAREFYLQKALLCDRSIGMEKMDVKIFTRACESVSSCHSALATSLLSHSAQLILSISRHLSL